jgi:DNA polymerase IV
MDAFFASVEQLDHPELRGKPIVVGGSGRRGVVAAASYEARKFGVKSAMPGMVAQRLCPELIFVKGSYDRYKEVSLQIREIFHSYTDLVEPLSLDEAYLDVTENKMGIPSAIKIAMEIRQKIFETTQLTASAGVSFNKFLAKVASDVNKPNGMKVIMPHEAEDFLKALEINKFHGIGKVTADKMRKIGIYTGIDLFKYSEVQLAKLFGKSGSYFYNIVRAKDDREVNPTRIRKSLGHEETFYEDIEDLNLMQIELDKIIEQLFKRLEKYKSFGRTLTLKAKSTDFQSHTRSISRPTEIISINDLSQIAHALLQEHAQEFGKIRLLGLTVSNFTEKDATDGVQMILEL